MATKPPLYRGQARSSRKPFQRVQTQRTVTSRQARERAKRVKIRDGFTCMNKQCGRMTHQLQCDHVIPIAYGGSEDDGNCQALCVQCHSVKSMLESNGMPLHNPSDFPTTYDRAKRLTVATVSDDETVNVSEIMIYFSTPS